MYEHGDRIDALLSRKLSKSIDWYIDKKLKKISNRIYMQYPASLVHGPAHARGVAKLTAYILRDAYPIEHIGLERPLIAALSHDMGHADVGQPDGIIIPFETEDKSSISDLHAMESCRALKKILTEEGYRDWSNSTEIFLPIFLHPRTYEPKSKGDVTERLRKMQDELYIPNSDVSNTSIVRSVMISFALRDADKIQRYSLGPPPVVHVIDDLFRSTIKNEDARFEDSVPRIQDHIDGIKYLSNLNTKTARRVLRSWNSENYGLDYDGIVRNVLYSNVQFSKFDETMPGLVGYKWLDTYADKISKVLRENSGEMERYVEMTRKMVDKKLDSTSPYTGLNV